MKHTTTLSAVGIDVAKATLSVCFRFQEGDENILTLRNIETDIRRKILSRLQGYAGRIVMESTGHYHWSCALILAQAGMDVRVVNPLLAKQYTAGSIRKVKTDAADASSLARMATVADTLPSTFSLSENTLRMRKKLAIMSSMTHQLQAMTASLKSLEESHKILGVSCSPAEQEVATAVVLLRRSLAHMEREFTREAEEADSTSIHLLASIPGVSVFCASLALHWFDRRLGTTAKSWIGFAGLDVSSRESGTWRGRCRLTKRGNSYLRARLFCAAWGAVMHDRDMKTYYDALKTQGRSHVEALVIIARKIVRMMFTMIHSGNSYDSSVLQKSIPVFASAI